MDMTTNYRALKIDNKVTFLVPKEHFDEAFDVLKATHNVIEVKVNEQLFKNVSVYLAS